MSVSIVLGIVAALPFILIWCFTGVYYPFVILFGMFMSFLLGCTVFYTPIGEQFSYAVYKLCVVEILVGIKFVVKMTIFWPLFLGQEYTM